ncbi:hypothetical protein ACFQZJ_11105 [Maribacter chungangensis]|uniref:Uncharacterized protein n=1 Tax=Maribacter chungangensis TaxID=1069117 RepID=A0ABW3B5G8_9FLAO
MKLSVAHSSIASITFTNFTCSCRSICVGTTSSYAGTRMRTEASIIRIPSKNSFQLFSLEHVTWLQIQVF